MAYYPIVLDLTDRPVLVVGGGPVGERKVQGLLEAGARVTLVAPRVTPALAALAHAGRVRHVVRAFVAGDVAGQQLVFAAVDDAAVTETVVAAARAAGVFVNAADDPARCDFILPSVLRRGDLVVAVSSGGASPALARAVRERLEAVLGEDYATLTAVAAEVRRELRDAAIVADAGAWRRALDDDVLHGLVRAGRRDEARRRLLDRLQAPARAAGSGA